MADEVETGPLFGRHRLLAVPDYRMLAIVGERGYGRETHGVITRSVADGVAADGHWIVFQCGNATVRVRLDITVWSAEPPPGATGEAGGAADEVAEQEHVFTVAFPDGSFLVDQCTLGTAAEIPLPFPGAYRVRVRGWDHRAVMCEAESIEQRATDEDWDLDREVAEMRRLDGRERYAVDLWPAG